MRLRLRGMGAGSALSGDLLRCIGAVAGAVADLAALGAAAGLTIRAAYSTLVGVCVSTPTGCGSASAGYHV